MCNLPERVVNQILEENKLLREKILVLEKRIEDLEHRLRLYDNPHTPPSRSHKKRKLIPEDLKKRPGQKPGHEGVTRPYPEPDKTIKVTAEKCRHCRSRLGRPAGFESRIIEDIPEPRQAIVTEYLLARYVCGKCGKETLASHPGVPQAGRFGKNTQSAIAAMKFRQRLPYRKIAEALKNQHGIDITPAAVLGVIGNVTVCLRPGYRAIEQRIMNAKIVYADETSIKVNGRKWWIWVFTDGKDVLVTVGGSRGQDVIESVLGPDFTGTIVCDGWKPYRTFTKRIQRCWAHLLREADDLAEKESGAAGLARALHNMFGKAKELLEKYPSRSERKEIWRYMRRWMGIWLNKEYQTETAQRFVRKVWNGYDHWFTFVLKPGVEPTNNTAERALREHVVQRKIIGCLRNYKGTFAHETIMSVFATWENHGYNIYQELGKYL